MTITDQNGRPVTAEDVRAMGERNRDRVDAMLRRPVFWDANAGGWCWRVRLDRAPVQAESWAAAWQAVLENWPAPAVSPDTPPAPRLRGPITPGDERVPAVRWWHRLFLP